MFGKNRYYYINIIIKFLDHILPAHEKTEFWILSHLSRDGMFRLGVNKIRQTSRQPSPFGVGGLFHHEIVHFPPYSPKNLENALRMS